MGFVASFYPGGRPRGNEKKGEEKKGKDPVQQEHIMMSLSEMVLQGVAFGLLGGDGIIYLQNIPFFDGIGLVFLVTIKFAFFV